MPKYNIISDKAILKSDEINKTPCVKVRIRGNRVMLLERTNKTLNRYLRSYPRSQQTFNRTIQGLEKDERVKIIEIEKAYMKICENESEDIKLITAGLGRYK